MSVTSLPSATPPLGSGGVPVEAELRAVDLGLEVEPDLLAAVEGHEPGR